MSNLEDHLREQDAITARYEAEAEADLEDDDLAEDDDDDGQGTHPGHVSKPRRYVLAFYELDRAYGGREEGGWWYDTGNLVRLVGVVKTKAEADRICDRANRLLRHLQRNKRPISSVIYGGGIYRLEAHPDLAPGFWPESKPTYS